MVIKKTTTNLSKKPGLMKAEGTRRFWVKDGKILSDVRDLKNALQEMAETTFSYHANKAKNDFAKWVDEVLQNKKLAIELKKAKNKLDALKKVVSELKKY